MFKRRVAVLASTPLSPTGVAPPRVRHTRCLVNSVTRVRNIFTCWKKFHPIKKTQFFWSILAWLVSRVTSSITGCLLSIGRHHSPGRRSVAAAVVGATAVGGGGRGGGAGGDGGGAMCTQRCLSATTSLERTNHYATSCPHHYSVPRLSLHFLTC